MLCCGVVLCYDGLLEFGVVVAAPGRGLGGPERTTADTDTGLGLALLLSAAVATENWRN